MFFFVQVITQALIKLVLELRALWPTRPSDSGIPPPPIWAVLHIECPKMNQTNKNAS